MVDVCFSKFGKVFDDEDSTVDSSDDCDSDDAYYDIDYDNSISDDDKDYEMWKSYNRGRPY